MTRQIASVDDPHPPFAPVPPVAKEPDQPLAAFDRVDIGAIALAGDWACDAGWHSLSDLRQVRP